MMNSPLIWLAVGVGGAVGAMARHGVSHVALRWLGPGFPWGTLSVNVVGSLMMGLVIVWLSAREPNPSVLRAFLTVGVLGAFTTFSTFAMDVMVLFERKAHFEAAGYLAASIAFAIGGLAVGLVIGRTIWGHGA